MTLYSQLGRLVIEQIITEFYLRAFADPIIGHFFFKKDRGEITRKQIQFATSMLGGPDGYDGMPLKLAHEPFSLRNAHFDRRQVIMREVLDEFDIQDNIKDQWLALEEDLRPLVVNATLC